LQGDALADLYTWAPKITDALQKVPELTDVSSDQQQNGLESDLVIDRDTAARLGITTSQVDNTLYDAFGQRQVSTIYNPLNQYHAVREVAPQYWQSPEMLKEIYVSTAGGSVSGTHATNAVAGTIAVKNPKATAASNAADAAQIASDTARNLSSNQLANTGHGSASSGAPVSTASETMIPLAAFSHFAPGKVPLAVNHQGLFVASTISFNLAPGKSLSDALAAINETMNRLGVPSTIHGTAQGTARVFQESLATQPILITAA